MRLKIFCLVAILFLLLSGCEKSKRFGERTLKVNGNYVSKELIQREWEVFFKKNKYNPAVVRMPVEEKYYYLVKNVLEKVLLEDYLNKNAKISEIEVSNYVEKYVKPSYYLNYEIELDMLPENYKDVVVEKSIYDRVKNYLLMSKLIPEMAKKNGVEIFDEEINNEFENQRTNQILLMSRIIVLPFAQRNLISKITDKESFIEFCKNYSIDFDTKYRGGFIGDLRRMGFIKRINKKITDIKENDIYEIKEGTNVIFVYIEKVIPFYMEKEDIANMLIMKKFAASEKYTNWINKLEDESKIEFFDPYFEVYYAYNKGDFQRAAYLYEKIFKKMQFSFDYFMKIVDCYYKGKNWKKLIKLINKYEKIYKENKIQFEILKAESYLNLGNKKKALFILNELKKKAINDPAIFSRIEKMELNLTN
ncbi:MAG: hypothetical protein N2258_01850 [Brevinematales bacterium]|nr:hypothetical protein [Brevinematales bacterium]